MKIRSVILPLLSLMIAMLGNGFFTTFTSLRFSIEGYPPLIVGVLNSSYYAGMMLGSIYIEHLINRIGHIRTFAIFASANSLIVVVQSMLIGPFSWTLLRLLTGLCASGFFIVIESWLLLSTEVKSRGKLLSLYMLALYLGQGFGQFFINITPLRSLFPFHLNILLSSLSVLPVCMIKSSGPPLLEPSITHVFAVLKRVPLGPVGCLIAGMIMSSFYGLAPIFGRDIHLSLMQISQIMGCTILGGLLLQWPIGYLSDIFSRRRVLIGVVFLLMIVTLILYKSAHFPYLLLLGLMVLFGGISFTFYPLSITLTCDQFPAKNIVGVTSTLLIVYGVGCVISPTIAPFCMHIAGPSGLFLFNGTLCALFIAIAMFRAMSTHPSDEEEQSDYLPLPRATSLAFYFDPRTDVEDEAFEEEGEEFYPLAEVEEYEDED